MAHYKTANRTQGLFLSINLAEQLLPGTYEFTLQQIIDKHIDLTSFDHYYQNDKNGAAAIEPRLLLKIIMYGYRKGCKSSKKLMKRCQENIVMKALAEDTEPYYSTISDFIKEKEEEIKNVFKEVLLVCDELKLIEGSTFAIDGCKITSNASKAWSGTHEELEKKAATFEKVTAKIVSQHQARDQQEAWPDGAWRGEIGGKGVYVGAGTNKCGVYT